MKRIIAIVVAAAVSLAAGCVCTETPPPHQRWYEYRRDYMSDGSTGNKPWFFWLIALPGYAIVNIMTLF